MNSLKILVTGDGMVGKTSLLHRYAKNEFPEQHEATVFDTYSVQVNIGGQTWDLSLFDTAGQEDYDSLRPLTYGNADVFVLCYSCMKPEGIDNLVKKWLPEKEQYNKDAPYVLVGTKTDLRNDKEATAALLKASGKMPVFCEDVDKAPFKECKKVLECSAKTGEGVRDVMNEIIKVALHHKMGGGKKKCEIL
jgi:small GTP-binding protein